MNREIIPKLKKIISEAKHEAKSMDDIVVKPEHILISILSDDNNGCSDALKNMKISLSLLNDIIIFELRNTNLTPRIDSNLKITIPFSKESRLLFKSVDYEAENLGDNHIDTTHLMMAILNPKNKITIRKVLNSSGINYENFTKTVKEMRDILDDVKGASGDSEDFDYSGSEDSAKDKKSKRNTPSKTPVLDNFCTDITKMVDENKIDPVVGRSNEIKRVTQILSRRKKNNPVLIGEAGVGKSSIAEGIALLIKSGSAPRTLIDKKIYSLDLASVVAGTKYRGQFEERIKAILDELKVNQDIILFIDELHTFIGAGNASGSLDASNIFKPALARGEIQVIGATTLDEFREHIEKDSALTRRFQQVLVEATTNEETNIILNNIKDKYEKYHSVSYTPEAIEECVKMADRYITDRAMPDKAIDVLDEAGASTNISLEKPENIKKLETKREEILKRKLEVVQQQKYEEAAELRDDERKVNEELTKAKENWLNSLDKKKTIVGVELIAETVSMMTGIPLSKISSQENKKLMAMDKELMGRVIGQDEAVIKVIKAIKRNRLGIRNRNKPIGSFIFLGPTGVGKCICGDTEITVRNKVTREIKIINIKNIVPDTN